ncbi:Uncharacterised protein [Mycobacteroides abscessus subsp. abscessus]|nr:Uncharacterised protein [Mycobacteroides abscessus subsp. abscessus]
MNLRLPLDELAIAAALQLAAFKVAGVITWGWGWVTAPIWVLAWLYLTWWLTTTLLGVAKRARQRRVVRAARRRDAHRYY